MAKTNGDSPDEVVSETAPPETLEIVAPGNEEFPVPFERFAMTLRGTDDEVFTHHLRITYGRRNHTVKEWLALLDGERHTPAHPGP